MAAIRSRALGIFVLLLVAAVPWGAAFGQVAWKCLSSAHGDLPAPAPRPQHAAALVLDVNKDGNNDFVIATWKTTDKLVWYRRDADGWTKLAIDDFEPDQTSIEAGGAVHDIDGDGDPDVAFGGKGGGKIWWWENPYPKYDNKWPRHQINSGGSQSHDQLFGDFDGDGKVEYVAWQNGAQKLLLFEIPDNPRASSQWPATTIFRAPDRRHEGLAAGDVNLDGKLDLVGAGRWFQHVRGAEFQEHVIDGAMGFTRAAVGQLVEGGRPEVVFCPGDANGDAKWYGWDGKAWVAHKLRYVNHGHTLQLGDVDRDGHLDVLVGEMGNPGAGDDAKTWIWYGNGRGTFQETVANHGQGIHEGKLADLDGDGDLDLLVKPFQHNAPRVDVLLNQGPRR